MRQRPRPPPPPRWPSEAGVATASPTATDISASMATATGSPAPALTSTDAVTPSPTWTATATPTPTATELYVPISVFPSEIEIGAPDNVTGHVVLFPARLRAGPSTQDDVLARLGQDVQVTIGGIVASGTWVLLKVTDSTDGAGRRGRLDGGRATGDRRRPDDAAELYR